MQIFSKKYRHWLYKGASTLIALSIVILNYLPVHAQGITFDCSDLGNQKESKLQGLIVVINEEPLGENISDIEGSSIKRCARKTSCSYEIDPKDSKKGQWKCSTTYEEVASCGKSEARPEAKEGAKYSTCEIVQAYVSASGADLLFSYIAQIYRYAALSGGIVAVFFLIIGGVMIAASGDNSDAVGKGKNIIIRSISGLILLFLSALILYTVNPNFFTI